MEHRLHHAALPRLELDELWTDLDKLVAFAIA